MSLNETVLSSIECPACWDPMTPPIYVCLAGHSICNICWEKLSTCPTCKMDLADTRNYTLENICETIQYPCKHQMYGCTETFKYTDVDEHSAICSFREYMCIKDDCEWSGRLQDIERHFFTHHDDAVLLGPCSILTWHEEKPLHEIKLLVAFQNLFYIHRIVKDDVMHFIVQYIGKSEDVNQYIFQVDIRSEEFKNRRIIVIEMCTDDLKHDDLDDIIDSGYAVGIPMSTIHTYKNKNSSVYCRIFIKKA